MSLSTQQRRIRLIIGVLQILFLPGLIALMLLEEYGLIHISVIWEDILGTVAVVAMIWGGGYLIRDNRKG